MYSICCASAQRLPGALTAAIKPEADYEWFTYKSRTPVDVSFRGKTFQISKGQVFGVRPSANKKNIRLIFKDDPTRVLTLTPEQATKLAKHV